MISQRQTEDSAIAAHGSTQNVECLPATSTKRGVYLRAAGSAKCCICGVVIGSDKTPENEVWPLDLDLDLKKYRWSHFSCAVASVGGDPSALQAPLCKHWMTVGRCSYRESCMYQHPIEALQQHQESQKLVLENNGRRRNRGENKRNRVLKQSRSFVFRRFLHDTFGLDLLRSGSGVVDVAGGKGELSFELQNLSEVPTTTLDPRIANLSQFYSKWERGFYGRNTFWAEYSPGFRADRKPIDPAEARMFLEKPLVDFCLELHSHRSVRPETEAAAESWFCDARKRAEEVLTYDEEIAENMRQLTLVRERERGREREGGADTSQSNSGQNERDDSEHSNLALQLPTTPPGMNTQTPLTEPASEPPARNHTALEQGRDTLQKSSDADEKYQATEPLVDFCLGTGKPFAVVPCCVFASLFPRRRLRRARKHGPGASKPELETRGGGQGAQHGRDEASEEAMERSSVAWEAGESGLDGEESRFPGGVRGGDGGGCGLQGGGSAVRSGESALLGVVRGAEPAGGGGAGGAGDPAELEEEVPVKTYADFVSYLLQKDSRIRETTLEFEGRNTVLYFNP